MNVLKTLTLVVGLISATAAAQNHEMKVVSTGPSQKMVRIHASDKYLLLPVEESKADSQVDLMVNGKTVKTFYVRLADKKVDYTVPLDLTPYRNEHVTLRVTAPKGTHTPQPLHGAKEPAYQPMWIKNLELADTFNTVNTEDFRPVYHHTPLYGWMNDPNGMFYKDGLWHLYYQWNPYGSRWQNMTWGHSTSPDLVNWTHHPAAIEPDDLGAIFSGSAAIDTHNTAGHGSDAVAALYTSAGDYQTQSLSFSTDGGYTFTHYDDNPVITLPTEARDPKVFYNPETGLWTLVLAHALEKEVLIFTSPDLKSWELQSHFGKGLGARDGVWECPDLFELTVDGNGQKKWMMIVNLNPGGPFGGSATQYFIGDFDGKTFTPDTTPGGYVPAKWLDFGKDFYATVTWSDAPDNRRTAIGWMSNWQYADQVPTTQFRSANTLPREIGLFVAPDGQIYASSKPSPELTALRGTATVDLKNIALSATTPKTVQLPQQNGGVCEIVLTLSSAKDPVKLVLSNDAGNRVTMAYDPKSSTVTFDRTQSGITDFSEDFPAITVAPTFQNNGKLQLNIFIDKASIEVFGNDGKFAMTNLVFPEKPYTQLQLSTPGKATVGKLTVYPLASAQ